MVITVVRGAVNGTVHSQWLWFSAQRLVLSVSFSGSGWDIFGRYFTCCCFLSPLAVDGGLDPYFACPVKRYLSSHDF
ncbi:hypothetical protein CBR_g42165 [Chara braunii]|uniref:Uncharacterized protein n=1 Tax=Chara braunii TaxID=69332 RepID=A0A388LX99_CHABU|nr:hypothetical protein CBR_g42165 [Chara braunii]|eukprot:GBG86881.1 hypothetical protein CBR_g42165 [Chara braunii]